MKIMLCGANDLKNLLPIFEEATNEMGLTALNFMSGNILYHNYGQNRWVENSIATVNDADILVFVINEYHGEITWHTEYNEAISKGKNFIVLCLRETYEHYRYIKDRFTVIPDELPDNEKNIIQELERIESLQITVVPFEVRDFKWKLKEQILVLFKHGITLSEKNNQKQTFLPVLKATKYKSILIDYKGQLYENIAREILFDFFEQKELRKRALVYFTITKSLSADEIISLFSDEEDGIRRKTIADLKHLLNDTHDLEKIITAAIEKSSESEVGFLRRVIASAFDSSIYYAIKHLPSLFPCQDIGTPRRIINQISQNKKTIVDLIGQNKLGKGSIVALVNLCLGYKSEKEWKETGAKLLEDFEKIT